MTQGGQRTSSPGSGFHKEGILHEEESPLAFPGLLSADCRTLAKGRKEDFVPDGGRGSCNGRILHKQ